MFRSRLKRFRGFRDRELVMVQGRINWEASPRAFTFREGCKSNVSSTLAFFRGVRAFLSPRFLPMTTVYEFRQRRLQTITATTTLSPCRNFIGVAWNSAKTREHLPASVSVPSAPARASRSQHSGDGRAGGGTERGIKNSPRRCGSDERDNLSPKSVLIRSTSASYDFLERKNVASFIIDKKKKLQRWPHIVLSKFRS
jgi:hypothetical protein